MLMTLKLEMGGIIEQMSFPVRSGAKPNEGMRLSVCGLLR